MYVYLQASLNCVAAIQRNKVLFTVEVCQDRLETDTASHNLQIEQVSTRTVTLLLHREHPSRVSQGEMSPSICPMTDRLSHSVNDFANCFLWASFPPVKVCKWCILHHPKYQIIPITEAVTACPDLTFAEIRKLPIEEGRTLFYSCLTAYKK